MSDRVAFEREIDDLVGVGAVDERGFRLWMRLPDTQQVYICVRSEDDEAWVRHPLRLADLRRGEGHDWTYGLNYPEQVPGARPLSPGRRYEVQVEGEGGRRLGGSALETSPTSNAATPDRFSIAVMSCHQPFDEDGELDANAERLLERLPDILDTYAVKRVLMLGDQMYADQPEAYSLFGGYFARLAPAGRQTLLDCDAEEVRRIYQQRHRVFFNSPGFRRVQSAYPCLSILDDHEIVDNFGSDPAHSRDTWRALRCGALKAAFDYQGLRAHSGRDRSTMDFGLRYGPFACYTLDLRTERVANEDELVPFGPGQLQRLQTFLQAHSDAAVFALALSVPLVHLPDWASALGVTLTGEGTDIAERWSNPKARPSRSALVKLLAEHQRRHPRQALVLLGGDVHVGMLARLQWTDPALRATQLTSSAVSNSQEGLEGFAAKYAAKLATVRVLPGCDVDEQGTHCEVELCGDSRFAENPYGDLNVGIVQFQRPAENAPHEVELKLVGIGDHGHPREVAWQRL